MKYCTNCNKIINADIKFCPDCGNKLAIIKEDAEVNTIEKKCPYCGFTQENYFKFCVKCGRNFNTGRVVDDNKKSDEITPKTEPKNVFKNIIVTIIMIALSIGYIYLIKNIDVTTDGLNENKIGLSHINLVVNKFFQNFIYKDICYKISKYLGYVPFLFVGIYALVGLTELIKNKSLRKVDFGIYMLIIAYALMVVVYFYFEKNIINYRPVFEADGTLEASFPSSHTLFSVVLCGTAFILNERLLNKGIIIKNKKLLGMVNTLIGILCFVIIASRALSGVHWITDIVGGIILGFTILSIYSALISFKA